jgi:hypothetical protein
VFAIGVVGIQQQTPGAQCQAAPGVAPCSRVWRVELALGLPTTNGVRGGPSSTPPTPTQDS